MSLPPTDPQKGVRGPDAVRLELGARQASEAGLVQAPKRLHPPKNFLDPVPDTLTERIAPVPGGVPIQAWCAAGASKEGPPSIAHLTAAVFIP